MNGGHGFLPWVGPLAVVLPGLAFLLLALAGWSRRPLGERATSVVVGIAFAALSVIEIGAVVVMAKAGIHEVRTPIGSWFGISHYGFHLRLVLDRLALPFSLLGTVLVGLVAAFSRRYLHREKGFARFYLLLCLLGTGYQLVVLAGGLDLAFIGWELVGFSSALLVAFFHERAAPVRHGLRAFITYRLCDIGLLGAAVWLHHTVGEAAVTAPTATWSGLVVPPSTFDATVVGLLLLWASMGKSAQLPLTGWLPRAMEGPTPSSAIFYGALSIHLGPYLLLRSASVLERSPVVAVAVVIVGLATATHATIVGRVQTDIKSALAYASATQVGLIFVEIGLGLRFVAVAHIVGHACVRTLQILRSPSVLADHLHLERAMGRTLPRTGGHLERLFPRRLQTWLYVHALERGSLDAFLRDQIVGRFVRFWRAVDRLDEQWVAKLGADAAVADEAHKRERRAGVLP